MSSSMYNIDKFNETNYDSLCLQIKAVFIHQDLWSTVCEAKPEAGAEIAIWTKKDEKAISTIILSITSIQISYIKNCPTAKVAWN